MKIMHYYFILLLFYYYLITFDENAYINSIQLVFSDLLKNLNSFVFFEFEI